MKTDFDLLGIRVNITSRSRRRWLVALLYAGFGALTIAWCAFFRQTMVSWIILFGYIFLSKFLGGRNFKGGLLPPFEVGDERERNRRNQAFYVAYKWWDFTLLPALLSVGLKNNPYYPAWHPAFRVFVDRLPFGLLIAAGILYYTMPQTIQLWTEPDMVTDVDAPSA
jgi:hypothetical protein